LREKSASAIGRENPRGAGNVAGPAGAIEAVGVGFDQPTDTVDHHGFIGEGVAVASQHVEKGLPGHESTEPGARSREFHALPIIRRIRNDWERGRGEVQFFSVCLRILPLSPSPTLPLFFYGKTAFCVELVRRE
jgi:hypothetical protein